MNHFTESKVEAAALSRLEALGWRAAHGPAPGQVDRQADLTSRRMSRLTVGMPQCPGSSLGTCV